MHSNSPTVDSWFVCSDLINQHHHQWRQQQHLYKSWVKWFRVRVKQRMHELIERAIKCDKLFLMFHWLDTLIHLAITAPGQSLQHSNCSRVNRVIHQPLSWHFLTLLWFLADVKRLMIMWWRRLSHGLDNYQAHFGDTHGEKPIRLSCC